VPRFLVDEDLPRSLARQLRASGIDAEDVRDVGLKGKSDRSILTFATDQGLALITADRGFGNLLEYPLGSHHGIILLRYPNSMPAGKLVQVVTETLPSIPESEIIGNLVIFEPGRIRFRAQGPGQNP